jgi:hypothetical protein
MGFGLREKPVAAVPASAGESEVLSAPAASAATIDAVAPEPANVAKSKAKTKSKSKVVAAPSAIPVKRKPGRPRKATA